jgi:hypothetical protein
MMRILPLAVSVAVIAVTLAQLIAPGADAQRRRGDANSGYGYVTADSRYGSGTITAPVRYGPHGRLEVRLPGGTWIECGRSCRDTLRRETIDFWSGGPGAPRGGDGPGYLRFRF